MVQIKPIPIYKGYFAGDDGFIYSSWTNHGINENKKRKLKAGITTNGYIHLAVRIKKGIYQYIGVHRLICMAFNGLPKNKKHTASHLDGNRVNNIPTNLIWESLSDNDNRKKEHGTYDGGYFNSRSKISKETLVEIRKLLSEKKMTHKQIGIKFGVNRVFITKINCGHRYKNV